MIARTKGKPIYARNILRQRNDPLRRLALEVIALAVKDARAGDIEAACWLIHEDAEPFYTLADIHPGAVWRVLRNSGIDAAIDIRGIMDLTSGPEERANAPQDLTQTTDGAVIGLHPLYPNPLPGGITTGF